MKPKQKHKRGADRYSLDFYTPLFRIECIDRLMNAKHKFVPLDVLHVNCQNDRFTVKLLYKPSLISIEFVGQLESTFAGIHVHGHIYYHGYIRFIAALVGLFVLGVCMAFNWSNGRVDISLGEVYFMEIGVGYLVVELLRTCYRRPKLLLRWIDEQLNVEKEKNA